MKWYSPHGAVTVWEHSPSGEVLIADCRNPKLPLASQRVNARLAAAAPDLLAALQQIAQSDAAAHSYPGDGWRLAHEKFAAFARAAIARAS